MEKSTGKGQLEEKKCAPSIAPMNNCFPAQQLEQWFSILLIHSDLSLKKREINQAAA